MPEPIPTSVADQATIHLTALQRQLEELGFLARLRAKTERLPSLRVINPDATILAEVVTASPREGEWLFWWSWAEPIVEVAHPDRAAERIGHVLTPAAHQAA